MNTTDIAIMCFDEDECIQAIEKAAGLALPLMSDPDMCGGPKLISLSMYGASIRCLDEEGIDRLVKAFLGANWTFPELASLTVSCDNNEHLSKVYTL